MKIIARMHNDFGSKFGIPRQSNVVQELKGRMVPYGKASYFRRKYQSRGICYPLSLSPQRHWSVQCEAGEGRASYPRGTCIAY
mgnify:CR=1 FL=1